MDEDKPATEAFLRELFSMEDEDGPLESPVATHDGDWVKRDDGLWGFAPYEDV